jgi:hypothetical protein
LDLFSGFPAEQLPERTAARITVNTIDCLIYIIINSN